MSSRELADYINSRIEALYPKQPEKPKKDEDVTDKRGWRKVLEKVNEGIDKAFPVEEFTLPQVTEKKAYLLMRQLTAISEVNSLALSTLHYIASRAIENNSYYYVSKGNRTSLDVRKQLANAQLLEYAGHKGSSDDSNPGIDREVAEVARVLIDTSEGVAVIDEEALRLFNKAKAMNQEQERKSNSGAPKSWCEACGHDTGRGFARG